MAHGQNDWTALMGGDYLSGVFTWKEKNHRNVKNDCPRAGSVKNSPCEAVQVLVQVCARIKKSGKDECELQGHVMTATTLTHCHISHCSLF